MSGRRAYTIIRGYINREWERLFEPEDPSAVNEVLNEWASDSAKSEAKTIQFPTNGITNREMTTLATDAKPTSTIGGKEAARNVLGVPENASLDEVHKAYVNLIDRCNPSRFPDKSPEGFKAAQIRIKVLEAYRTLTTDVDSTELRFNSIEIE